MVFSSSQPSGIALTIYGSIMDLMSAESRDGSRCWVDNTIQETPTGTAFSYLTVNCDFESGPKSFSTPAFLASAKAFNTLWA